MNPLQEGQSSQECSAHDGVPSCCTHSGVPSCCAHDGVPGTDARAEHCCALGHAHEEGHEEGCCALGHDAKEGHALGHDAGTRGGLEDGVLQTPSSVTCMALSNLAF